MWRRWPPGPRQPAPHETRAVLQRPLSSARILLFDEKGQIRLGFDSLPGESRLQTILGGFMRTTVQLDVHTPIPIFVGGKLAEVGIQVTTDLDFDYASGVTVSSGNSQKLAGLGLDFIVPSIAVEMQLNRTVFFEPGFLQGMIFMEHLESGLRRQTPFQADTMCEIHRDLLLDRPGFWEISFGEIELSQNLFYQTLGANVEGRISVALLGDLGRVQGGLAFPVGSPFALQFDPIAKLGSYIVRVPEPGSSLIAVLGLIGPLASSPRRRG